MAAPSILTHISYKELSERIKLMGDRMDELKRISDDYKVLNEDVKTFMGETDDNFEMMRENVRKNIEMVGKAYAIAKANQERLQDELENLDRLQTNVGTTLDTGRKTLEKTVNLISVASDLDF